MPSITGSASAAPSRIAAEHGESRTQRIAETEKAGGREDRRRQRALPAQPAMLGLLPGVRLRGREKRQPHRLEQACGRGDSTR